MTATTSIFTDFLGKEVKVPYRDGSQYRIARGVFEDTSNEFVKIRGTLGTIVINQKNIEKMSIIASK